MDKVTAERRSENMRRIRSANTKPELLVRRALHSRGLRYRIHRDDLPGKPDLVFPALRACVFVHGCFWHGCRRCVDGTRRIKSRGSYWNPKIAGNRRRDAAHAKALRALGWRVFVIWECELRTPSKLNRMADALLRRKRTITRSALGSSR